MSIKRDVAVRTMALLLLILWFAVPAASQDQREQQEWQRSLGSPERSQPRPQAPVGHRQPTAADISKDLPTDPDVAERAKRDRELDAKLRICRGC
jgi:hypothetical protein